jgi:hypothetical protein
MLHAYGNPMRVFAFEEGFSLLIGGGVTGALCEIGVVEAASGAVIVHAMPAREKFLK